MVVIWFHLALHARLCCIGAAAFRSSSPAQLQTILLRYNTCGARECSPGAPCNEPSEDGAVRRPPGPGGPREGCWRNSFLTEDLPRERGPSHLECKGDLGTPTCVTCGDCAPANTCSLLYLLFRLGVLVDTERSWVQIPVVQLFVS